MTKVGVVVESEANESVPSEDQIIQVLRAIMARADLDNLTCGDVWVAPSPLFR